MILYKSPCKEQMLQQVVRNRRMFAMRYVYTIRDATPWKVSHLRSDQAHALLGSRSHTGHTTSFGAPNFHVGVFNVVFGCFWHF